MRRVAGKRLAFLVGVWVCLFGWNPASGVQIWLKDGRMLEGGWSPLEGLTDVPKGPEPEGVGPVLLVVVVDDELRRTFIPKRQIERWVPEGSNEIFEKFRFRQRIMRAGPTVQSVGPFAPVEPFDEWFKSLFELDDRVWHRGLDNNQTQLLAALFAYQVLVRYNHRRGNDNGQVHWILDTL